ncbi:MAG: hypothetical protein GX208_06240 [Firmicutes bacterium]|nr:hypothetical protein [Bacillota bacterium]
MKRGIYLSTVIGVFKNSEAAEKAVKMLREKGFGENEISIIARDEGKTVKRDMEVGGDLGGSEDITDGTAWGGALGGLAGLLAGVGALVIPGIGPIVAAGPIAGVLSGAVTGGVAGGLIDLGIPEERGKAYEQHLKSGGILAVVETSEDKVQDVSEVLRNNGAVDVESHGGENF